MNNYQSDVPQVGQYLDAVSPKRQLERKVAFTKLTACVETITYIMLIPLMFRRYVLDVNETTAQFLARRVIAYFHGIISVAYGVMILDLFRVLGWSRKFVVLTLAGPLGAIFAYARLKKGPLPEVVDPDLMLF